MVKHEGRIGTQGLLPERESMYFNGGIYRDVSLIVTEPIQIAWYGTFVTTPDVSDEMAKILMSTELENHTDSDAECVEG